MNPHYELVARRAGFRCEYCCAPESVNNFGFEVEHIVPPSGGGGNEAGNLALACRACNVRKSDRTSFKDPHTGQTVPLFHPRRDSWTEHFRVDRDQGLIMGITPTGRATVNALDLNHPRQVVARLLWIQHGLYV